jgi:ubiquitin thioesterase OTU1
MAGFTLKLKTKKGQHVCSLEKDTTMKILLEKIAEITQICESELYLLMGFPPKPIDLSQKGNTLEVCGISNGETLIVEEKPISKEDKELAEKLQLEEKDEILAKQLANEITGSNGFLLKKVVPADNSCLFTSIGFTLTGKIDTENGNFMRQVIAQQVNDDKGLYNEGILGRPNDEYCAWIMQTDSWGGAIEVSILSQYYGIGKYGNLFFILLENHFLVLFLFLPEIDVVDITNALINRFGEDRSYGMRVFLLFDGIHYDPLFLESLSVSFTIENS